MKRWLIIPDMPVAVEVDGVPDEIEGDEEEQLPPDYDVADGLELINDRDIEHPSDGAAVERE